MKSQAANQPQGLFATTACSELPFSAPTTDQRQVQAQAQSQPIQQQPLTGGITAPQSANNNTPNFGQEEVKKSSE